MAKPSLVTKAAKQWEDRFPMLGWFKRKIDKPDKKNKKTWRQLWVYRPPGVKKYPCLTVSPSSVDNKWQARIEYTSTDYVCGWSRNPLAAIRAALLRMTGMTRAANTAQSKFFNSVDAGLPVLNSLKKELQATGLLPAPAKEYAIIHVPFLAESNKTRFYSWFASELAADDHVRSLAASGEASLEFDSFHLIAPGGVLKIAHRVSPESPAPIIPALRDVTPVPTNSDTTGSDNGESQEQPSQQASEEDSSEADTVQSDSNDAHAAEG